MIDPTVLANLYRDHYTKVLGLCLRILAQREDAEDVAHDVFIQVARKYHTFEGRSTIGTWLHRLAVNQALMLIRKRARKPEGTTLSGYIPEHARDAEQDRMVECLRIEAAINFLPPGYKAALILHDYAGYEHVEVGAILGITDGTSKSQLAKARQKTRKLLREVA